MKTRLAILLSGAVVLLAMVGCASTSTADSAAWQKGYDEYMSRNPDWYLQQHPDYVDQSCSQWGEGERLIMNKTSSYVTDYVDGCEAAQSEKETS